MNYSKYILLALAVSIPYLNAQDAFILITVLYNEKHPQRMQEYKECLEKNLKHPAIESIHIIYDTTKDDKSRPLYDYLQQQHIAITTYGDGRPTFKYCFELANTCYPQKKIILMNADIFFDDTLNQLLAIDLTSRLFALTRWDLKKGKEPCLMYIKGEQNDMSQDVWIFQTPMRDIDCRDLRMGTAHCEGQLARAAHNAGLSLYNPCLSIKCFHLHLSGVRHYWRNSPAPANRLALPWCRIEDIPSSH